jgi:hypothetical protein
MAYNFKENIEYIFTLQPDINGNNIKIFSFYSRQDIVYAMQRPTG